MRFSGCKSVHAKRGRGAFTLIELVIVLAIASILTTIAVPSLMKSIRQEKTRYAAEELISKFSSARSYAISRNTYSKFIFQPDTNSYLIQVYNPDTHAWNDAQSQFVLPYSVQFKTGSITFDSNTATFDPFGSLTKGGEASLVDSTGYEIKLQALIANGQLNKVG